MRFQPYLPRRAHALIVVAFALLLFGSLDMNGYREQTYRLRLQPVEGSGPVHVVFYGKSFQALKDRAVKVPKGWSISRFADGTILTADHAVEPIVIITYTVPIIFSLQHGPGSGRIEIQSDTAPTRTIDLNAEGSRIESFDLGGPDSMVRSSGPSPYSTVAMAGMFLIVVGIFYVLAWVHETMAWDRFRLGRYRAPTSRGEVLWHALPLLTTSIFVLLSFYPGHASPDSALQWSQANHPGHLDPSIGIPATLFMRLFSHLSSVPVWLITAQLIVAACAVALVLRELRWRGLPFGIGLCFTVLLALSPQYAIFFTYLSKDPLCAIGVLYLMFGLLRLGRHLAVDAPVHADGAIILSAALFAGMMRFNAMPSIAAVMCLLAGVLACHRRVRFGAAMIVCYLILAFGLPKLMYYFSIEGVQQRHPSAASPDQAMLAPAPPYGHIGNFYIYHLFSAAAHSGLPLREEDTHDFFQIAPRDAWATYDCFMTDTTFTAVTTHRRMNDMDYQWYLFKHQPAMAHAVGRIIEKYPSVLWERQKCITAMLWQTGYRQHPFQVTLTMGYDNVTPEFVELAGPNRSLLGRSMQRLIIRNVSATTETVHFWKFWRPALPLILGLFVVALWQLSRRDAGVWLAAALPVSLTLCLMVVIPFPAYRYQYPAVLVCLMFLPLLFTRRRPSLT